MNKKREILVIDDNQENLQVLGGFLENEGYEVRVALNGEQALENAREFPPDLFLLDLMLPGMNGHEVCRRIKKDPALSKIPVIILSAIGLAEHKVVSFKEGAVDYITKPFNSEEVSARVKTHLKLVHVAELEVEIAERKLAEEKANKSLREKEILISELYHRTKNMIQIMHSILKLQAAEYKENEELQRVVENAGHRFQAMSLVHQLLFEAKDLSEIYINTYIHDLTSYLYQSFSLSSERISLNLDVEEQKILIDTMVPLGLIINELLTNSLKHAFPENRKGSILVSFYKDSSDNYILQYSDDGVGFPSDFDFKNLKTLGIKFIYLLGENQMGGSVNFNNSNGMYFKLKFSSTLYKRRV